MFDAIQRYELRCQACCSGMLTRCCLDYTDGRVQAWMSTMLERKGLEKGGYGSWLALQRSLQRRFTVVDGRLLHNGREVVPRELWGDMVLSTYNELVKDGSTTAVQLASRIHDKLALLICVDPRQHGLGLPDITAIISAQPDVFHVAGTDPAQRAPVISQHETECHFFVEAPHNSVVWLHVSGAWQELQTRIHVCATLIHICCMQDLQECNLLPTRSCRSLLHCWTPGPRCTLQSRVCRGSYTSSTGSQSQVCRFWAAPSCRLHLLLTQSCISPPKQLVRPHPCLQQRLLPTPKRRQAL